MAITTKKLVAEEYVVSSSVTLMTQSLSSGSTVFGDSMDDTHRITGSLFVSGGIATDGSAGGTATFKGSSAQSTLNLQTSVDNFIVGLSNSSGRIDLRPAGTTALTAINSGNVGIGNTNPSHPLDVAGNARVTNNFYLNNYGLLGFDAATEEFRVYATSGNELKLSANGHNSHITIDTSGNVGIGGDPTQGGLQVFKTTVRITADTPELVLHDTSAFSAGTGPSMYFQGLQTGESLQTFAEIQGVSTSTANQGELIFKTRKDGSQNEAMRIDQDRNVGIGTTNPQKVLEVIVPENNFVSFALQHSPGSHAGIHFGYRENNNLYRHSQLRFQRTDRFANNAMGRIMLINKTATDSSNPGESDAHLTIDELGFVGIGRNVGGHYSTGPRIQALLHVSASSVVGTATASLHVEGSGSLVVSVDGTQGRLFSISDELSGSLFSANTISGLPVIEAFSDNKVTLGPYSNPVTVTSTGNISGSSTSTGSFGRVEASRVRGDAIFVESDSAKISKGDNNTIRFDSPTGNVKIGSQNVSYMHFYTDRGKYYFNKRITVDEGIISSFDENLTLQREHVSKFTLGNTINTSHQKLEVEGDVSSSAASTGSFGRIELPSNSNRNRIVVGANDGRKSINVDNSIYLASGNQITWANGDARIVEGSPNNYDLKLGAYNGVSFNDFVIGGSTTGNVFSGSATSTGSFGRIQVPKGRYLEFLEGGAGTADKWQIFNSNSNIFEIKSTAYGGSPITIDATGGGVNVAANLDVGAGVDVTGASTFAGDITLTDNVAEIRMQESGDTNYFVALRSQHNAGDTFLLHGLKGEFLKHIRTDDSDEDTHTLRLGGALPRVDIVANSSVRMLIDENGNVGINESSPAAKLHVSTADSGVTVNSVADDLFVENNTHGGITIGTPNSVSGYLFFADPEDNAGAGINYNHSTNKMSIAAGGTTRMVVSGSGKVGIGTNAPTESLMIRGNGTGTNGFAYPSIAGYTQSTKLWALEQHFGYEGRLGLYDTGTLKVLFRASGSSYINTGSTLKFGIGTDSPSYKLHVNGTAFAKNLTLSGWSSGDGLTLNYGNATGTVEAVTFKSNGGVSGNIKNVLVSANSGDLHFNAANRTNQIVAYRDGKVGIGTNVPSQLLDVYGSIQVYSDIRLYNGTSIRFHGNGVVGMNGSATTQTFGSTAGSVNTHFSVGGVSAAMVISGSTGNVGIGTTNPSQKLHVHGGHILITGGPSDGGSNGEVRFTYISEGSYGVAAKIAGLRNDADQAKGGDLAFYTQADNTSDGGTERFRIDADGQLIIRANNKYLFGLTTGNATVALIGMDTGNYIRLAASGYGVRTANGDWSLDGADNMTVNANAYFAQYLYHSGDTDTYMQFLDDRLLLFAGGDEVLDYEEGASSILQIANGGEADINFGGGNMFIGGSQGSYDGKVGIGTTNPVTNFAVGSGTSAVVFDTMLSWNRPFIGVNVKASSTNGRMVRIASSTTDYPVAIAMGYQDVASFGSEDSKGGINLITVGSNISGDIDPDTYSRLYVHKDGNIGINETSPSYKLDVNGTGRFTGQVIVPGGSNTTPGLMFDSSNDGFFHDTADPGQGIKMMVNNANDFLFANGGDFHADGSVISNSSTISDSRLKTNISTITSAVDKVKQLRGVTFDWAKGKQSGSADIGVIAQEVETVLPELVQTRPLPLWETKDASISGSYKTVDYERLAAVLIESVKEQQTKLEQLEAEIEKLKGG